MTVVVKLGSSIVAADDGELRADVLDASAPRSPSSRRRGERWSWSPRARSPAGCGCWSWPARPRGDGRAAGRLGGRPGGSVPRLRAAARRARRARGAGALTASDIAARTNYLNARQTLRRLLEWDVVPVVNENDTTATDEITFGDNDFLSAQVAILLEARLLVLLTDIAGLHTADPRREPDAELVEEVTDFAAARAATRSATAPPLRPRRHAQQGRGCGDGERGRDPAVICDGTAPGTLAAAAAGEPVGHPLRPQPERRPRASSSGCATGSPPAGRLAVDEGAARVLREQGSSLLPVGITGVEGSFEAGEAVEVDVDGEMVGKGISNYSADEMRRIKGLQERRGARADAARRRGGRAPRLLRARLSPVGPRNEVERQRHVRRPKAAAEMGAAGGYPLQPWHDGQAVAASCAAARRRERLRPTAKRTPRWRATAELLRRAQRRRSWRPTRPISPTSAPRA